MDNGSIAFPKFQVPMPANVIRGSGKLTWLSSKAGLIAANRPSNGTVSFQLKDFCDQGVTDLTTVLRPGFLLTFQALPSDSNDWIANYVSPLLDQDLNVDGKEKKEIDLEAADINCSNSRDPYSLEAETNAVTYLLNLFVQCRMNVIPLSSLHSRISNSGDEGLYRYIGSSSLKRRQFIERRSYIFGITENDGVYLQPPDIYTSVFMLAGFLLRRGGAAASDALFSFFHATPQISRNMKDSIGTHRARFVDFLNRHPFVFSPFPAKFFVSVRRNIPYFEYHTFIDKHFPLYYTPAVLKQTTYCNTSHVARIMQFTNGQFGQNMIDDTITPIQRPPATANWLGNETIPTAGPPLSAGLPNPTRTPQHMHGILHGSNSNDFMRDTFSSTPLIPTQGQDFRRSVAVQASSDVGVGQNVGCTCKCSCGFSRPGSQVRDANGFIPFFNLHQGLMHDRSPPNGLEDGKPLSATPITSPHTGIPLKHDVNTFSAAPGGPVSRTSSTSQTPVDEPDWGFEYAFPMPYELKFRSLKL